MRRVLQIFFGVLGVALIVFVLTRKPETPNLPRWREQAELAERSAEWKRRDDVRTADIALVRGLLAEGLSDREFEFAVVAEGASGKKVIPLEDRKSGARVRAAVETVLTDLIVAMSQDDSPVRGLRRINEGSRFFEDGLLEALDAMEGVRCEIPQTREGKAQRSGYPDLKITDEATGEVYYLDPKLMETGSEDSTLRTFYFEPKGETLKITEDATHLLVGIEHDGNDGEWKFLGFRFVDLANLKVRLKAEFQASNRDLYGEGSVLDTGDADGKDGAR